ncbi:hypothetical protein QLX08_010233 [Tetragonisca angustula]|uniref:tRNA (cytosine(38)-C(5))-methyltransferase n=1 Tax=Tetragonisca angustula TaxID=166442 RepID=A0AAW0ZCU8_9HYME
MRVLELYSGIGGMHYALQESGIKGDIVAAVDINTIANSIYKYNFPDVLLMNCNVQSLSAKQINDLNIDTILMSPPCQPYTRLKTLRYILLENVKGFEKSEMRNAVLKCMNASGFNYKELILSPCQFGIPNTRHRYYLLAKRKDLQFCFDHCTLNFNLPEAVLKALPKSKHNLLAEGAKTDKKCYKLENILENVEASQYLIPRKLLQTRAWLFDVRTSQSDGSCCFTKAYSHYVEGTGSIYCPYTKEIIQQTFLEANKYGKKSLEASEVLQRLMLRYFTPREVCRLMCFPEEFVFPEHVTCKQKYRLLGNSINVHVVSRLIFLLYTEKKIA